MSAKDRQKWSPELREAYDDAQEALRLYDYSYSETTQKTKNDGAKLFSILMRDVERRLQKLHDADTERAGREYESMRVLGVIGTAIKDRSGWGGTGAATDVTYTKLGAAEGIVEASDEFLQQAKILDADIKKHRRDTSQGEPLSNEEWEDWVKNRAEELGLDPDMFRRLSGSRQRPMDINALQDRLSETVSEVEEEAETASTYVEEIRTVRGDEAKAQKLLEGGLKGKELGQFLSEEGVREFDELYPEGVPDEASAVAKLLRREIDASQQTRGRQPAPGELDVDPETLSPGTDLTASEREREFGVSEQPAVPEMEAAAIEADIEAQEAADLREAEIETEKTLAEDFAAAEFGVGEPGSSTGGGDPELDLSSRLGDIGGAFGIADQFGYRYFLFEPGTDTERQDMMIDDPDNPGTQINVLRYITGNNLTNEAEILEAFKQTEWFNETSETMQNFDLTWDAAGPWEAWDDLTARREEIIKTEKDYIIEQLDLLGITDQVEESQINKLAVFAKRNGMDFGEVRDYLSDAESGIDFESYIQDADEGLLATYKNSLATTAAAYMVDLEEDQINMFVEGLYDADDPAAQLSLFKNQFRNMAKERFPTLSGVIDQGITPQQYFAPYASRVSKLLERPVDFMSERDSSLFDQIAAGMPDDKFGQRTMTFSEMNKYVRGLDEWQYTKNANDEARKVADNVGRMFGFVA